MSGSGMHVPMIKGARHLRGKEEMMGLLLGFAEEREEIRLVTLEGSRANAAIVPDTYQDYDISYFVTDRTALLASDDWLDRFGEQVILQKPEDMELFPPELGSGFSCAWQRNRLGSESLLYTEMAEVRADP
ncbi:putative aminoglycoside 6-adenylyltransferase [Paenibacillus sp. 598K]|nr:putative aminoglycoside 6-adenylyltransferase [Paenibacillus sp. 598K]